MNQKYDIEDCKKLAVVLASHETSVIPTDWLTLTPKWTKKNLPEFVVQTMINCFCRFTLEEVWQNQKTPNVPKKREEMEEKLKKIVFNDPIKEMPMYAVDASLNNPEGIFAEWRLRINK